MKKFLVTFAFVLAAIPVPVYAQVSVSNGQTAVVLATLAAPYVVGDICVADSTTTLSLLSGVATGNALLSGGVGTLPLFGKIGLTTHITGILPVANGGTGLTTATYGAATPASSTGFGTGVAGVIQVGSIDFGGRVTIGTGGDTTGAITLGGTYAVAPHCVGNNETSDGPVYASASTTILTLRGTFTAADKITWVCK